MTDLQTIQKFVQTCHVFNVDDAGTRTNIRTLIIPALRRYRTELVADLAFARRSAVKLSYADILAQNRDIRSAIAAAERSLKGGDSSYQASGYDVDGQFDEYGAFDSSTCTNDPQPTWPVIF
ncbi:hypothetical protein ABH908_000046 [Pseudomonas frederiksbergensis]|uniref:hypothetical protein n=1 Tax=Pseudomonas TaxID=286 RepID=UPI003D1F460C